MEDDVGLLSRPLAAGVSAVTLLIAAVIAAQLVAGVITWNYYPMAIWFAFISNIFVAPIFLFLATKYKLFMHLALGWLHLSMAVMIIYFSQTYSPFTVSWAILILIASNLYAWKGFLWSSFVLVLIAVGYIVLFPENVQPVLNYAILSILVVTLTIFMSFLFVQVFMVSRRQARELYEAQQSEQIQLNRLNTLLNSITDAVITLNRYGRVTSQNAAAQAFFDTNRTLVGQEIDQLLNVKDVDGKPVSMHTLLAGTKSSGMRDDLSTVIGEDTRHISLHMSRIRSTFDDSEEYGTVLIIRDITKQKTLEEEKDEFISVTSHELRTPVAIAEGSLSNLLVMFERQMDEKKIEKAADAAHEQIVYLSKMINDLSTLSRAERGVGDAAEVIDVNELLHKLYERYAPEASKKRLQLDLEVEPNVPSVQTSRLYLEEVLQNFITNSIKYTKTGKVTIGAKVMPDNKLCFSVSDTGIGMNKTDLDHIFEKFYRSEDYRTRETSGTGLGLYVVNKLAAKLDTKIDVKSRLNHGSTFSFVLEAHHAEQKLDESVAEVEKAAQQVA